MAPQPEEARAEPGGLEHRVTQLEGELAGARLAFRELVERATSPILLHREGRVLLSNGAFAQLLGYQGDEGLVGRDVLSLVHPVDVAATAERVRAIYQTGAPAPVRDVRMLRRDGSEVTLQVHASLVLVDQLPTVLVWARAEEAPRSEEARLPIDVRALQADRMACMGSLAAGVAHEINNPLGFTLANVAFALEELSQMETDLTASASEGPAELEARVERARGRLQMVVDALREARRGSDRVRIIVRDLKMFAGSDAAPRDLVDVRRVVDAAATMAQSLIGRRARLEKEYALAPPIEGNEARLAQVFLNLLTNAAEAIPEGDAEHQRITVRVQGDSAGRCVVEVSDTGRGISPEHLRMVFDPFFTTRPGNATGLGLSICHTLVTALGGTMGVESTVGRGTTFRVLLPGAKEERAPVSSTRTSVATARRGRVLVLDDEPMMARAVQRLLSSDHDVEAQTDPVAVLELLRAGARFDVILCDLMMPAMTGMDVYEAVLELDPAQARRMVFMTGGAYTPRAAEFLARTENPHIEKPLERAALRALVRAQLP